MRFVRLDLTAFGSFTERSLEFDPSPKLSVIYGDNEAGKSTALRAVSALLYGVPDRTRDNHLHDNKALRVGATLLLPDGTTLAVVRRKGRKNTLLDPSGGSVPEERLQVALQGVDDLLYHDMFGLDHNGLRRGARALLEGNSLGETLFQAGAGGANVTRLLQALDDEASGLYKSRGSKPKLNQALKRFKQAQREVKDSVLRASQWEELHQEQREIRKKRELDKLERDALGARLERLKNDRRLLPLLAELTHLKARMEDLGDTPRLPSHASEERVAATQRIEQRKSDNGALHRRLTPQQERLATLASESALTRIDPETISWVSDAKGGQRKAEQELPQRLTELEAIESEIAALVAELRPGAPTTEAPESLLVPAAAKERIRSLSAGRGRLETLRDEKERRVRHVQAQLQRWQERLETTPPPPDVTRLRHTFEQAQRLGDAPHTRATLDAEHRAAEQRMDEAIAQLDPWSGSPAQLVRLHPPSAERVDAFAEQQSQYREEQRAQQRKIQEIEDRRRANQERLAQHGGAADVPTESALATLRERRNELWGPVHSVLEGQVASDAPARGQAFIHASGQADDMADRLWREAARVHAVASCQASERQLSEELAQAHTQLETITAHIEENTRQWQMLWADILTNPPPPSEMREWLRQYERASTALESRRAAHHAVEVHDAAMASTRQALNTALLERDTAPPKGDEADWDGLVVHARRELEAAQQAQQDHKRLIEDIHSTEQALFEARNDAKEAVRTLEAWTDQWEASVAPLGLARKALPEESEAVLERLERLRARIDEANHLRRQIASIQGERERFDEEVSALVNACRPELCDLPRLERADRLVHDCRQAWAELEERRRLDTEIAELEQEIATNEAAIEVEQQRLNTLLHTAGVETLEALVLVEERAATRRETEQAIATLERRIVQFGDGASVDILLERAKGFEPEAMQAQESEMERQLHTLDDEIQALDQTLGTLDSELKSLSARSAAQASEDAEAELATVGELARRYARAKLAAVVLRRQIEEYRQLHQGPILEAANRLFPRLTVGKWSGLEVDYNAHDEPTLVCVRQGGQRVALEGLSEGTCDSLFLALRVASLYEFSRHQPALPLILDDALVHFDDDRVAAAMAILGELAQKMQILFFTHHRRIVELAHDQLSPEHMALHEL